MQVKTNDLDPVKAKVLIERCEAMVAQIKANPDKEISFSQVKRQFNKIVREVNMECIKVGETHPVKMGPKSSDDVKSAVILEERTGMVKSYLIDIPSEDSSGGLLGVATLSPKTGEMECTTALPYKDVGEMDSVAKQLGF